MTKQIKCPVCERKWPIDSEQGRAVMKRKKCIVCIVAAKERIKMNPYEFRAK